MTGREKEIVRHLTADDLDRLLTQTNREKVSNSDSEKLLRKLNHEHHTDQLYALFHGTCRSRSSLRYYGSPS
jgi:hypothetical protein